RFSLPRHNNQSQPDHKKHKHHSQFAIHIHSRSPKLLPDKHTPQCSHQGRSLSQSIRNCWTSFTCSNQVERIPQTPNHPSQYTSKMCTEPTFEISRIACRFADERLFDHDTVEEEVAEEYPYRKDKYRGIGCHFADF